MTEDLIPDAVGVILAAGRGERMRAGRNKALLPLAGRPMLLHSVEALGACLGRLLIVAAEADMDEVGRLAPSLPLVAGGATRQESEWLALRALRNAVGDAGLVILHDAARPLVAIEDVRAVCREADRWGAAMLARPAQRCLLQISAGTVKQARDRTELWRAETPQAARMGMLWPAYQRAAREGFQGTDTAAVLAHAGYEVRIAPASGPNPKITTPQDLPLAELLLGADREQRQLS